METMLRPIRFALTTFCLSLAVGCASEVPGLSETDGGFLTSSSNGGSPAFGSVGGADPGPTGPTGPTGSDVGAGGETPGGAGGAGPVVTGGGGSAYGGTPSYGSGGTTGSGGGLGTGGSCVPGTLFCPAAATGGAGGVGGQSGGGGTGGAALKCDNAICWDVFDCVIFHADLLACNFTKCEAFVCKP